MAPPHLGAVLSGAAGPDGVRTALGAPSVREPVRRAMVGLLAPGAVLGPVRFDRVKLKPGRKLSVWGRAAVVDGDGTRTAVPVAITWVPPPAAPASASEPGELPTGTGLRAWHAVDEATGMELLASPFDPATPELPTLVGPGAVPGRPRVTTVRYRPRQRHVVRYDGEGGRAGARWAKLVPGRDGETAAATARALADGLAERGPAVAAIRPLGLLAGDAVLYPTAAGHPLPSLLGPGRAWPPEALRLAGGALRQLHDLPVPPVLADAVPAEQDVAAVARAGEHLAALDPTAAQVLGAVLEAAGSALTSFVEPVPTHGDCKLDHLWLHRGTVTFIDVDSAAVADPARDLGKLLADLRWWTARHGLRELEGARAAVAAGYGEGERWGRAASWEALLLAKAVVRRCSLLEPGWTERTRAGLRRAAALVPSAA
jgi:Phosphotransferase enzyme family